MHSMLYIKVIFLIDPGSTVCDGPPAGPNYGDIMGPIKNEYNEGDMVFFMCSDGYTLQGATNKTCMNEEWIPRNLQPRCEGNV